MQRYRLIYAKRALMGLFASACAVLVTVWAIDTYAGHVASPYITAGAASLATFYTMTLALRSAVKEAYRAGEVGRRLPRSVEQRAIGQDREFGKAAKEKAPSFQAPPMIQTDLVETGTDN